jgi:hypothetical protein
MWHMPTRRDIEGLGRVAGRQSGQVTRSQLHRLGFSDSTIHDWARSSLLTRRLPKVFALGYVSTTIDARLWEAVLYAGPGAMLSHLTAAQWCGYIKYAPQMVQVSTPRKIVSISGVVVHARRTLDRHEHAGIPVTAPGQTLLDLATQRPELLARALPKVDYLGIGLGAIHHAAQSGHRGAGALRRALTSYDPNFGHLNDEFEIDFYALCREWSIDPLPIPNVEVAPRLTVDALWPEHHLAVELDGRQNHSSPAQLLRDAERDLACRRLGLTVIRYRRAQITRRPGTVRDDLIRQLTVSGPSGRR